MAKSNSGLAGIFEEVQSSNLLPKSRCKMKVLSATEGDTNGKKVFAAQLQVVKPKALAGRMHFENFRVGTNDDPEANQPSTWTSYENFAARQLKDFLIACQVEGLAKLTPSKAFAACAGKVVGAALTVKKDERKLKRDGTPNEYFGSENQRVKWFKDGQYTYEVLEGAEGRPAGKPEPEDDEDEAPKAAPAKAKKAKPAPEPEPEEEEEEDDEDAEDEDSEDAEGDEDEDEDDEEDED